MPFNQFYSSLPTGHRVPTTSVRCNIFELGVDTVNIALTGGAADHYEIRNYEGDVVQTGSVPTGATTLTVTGLGLGWYRLYLVRPSSLDSTWGFSGGETNFIITRPSIKLPVRPAAGASQGTDISADFPTRGYIRAGVQRQSLYLDSTNGAGQAAASLADRMSDADYEVAMWGTADPARPQFRFACFPNGTGGASPTTADTTQIGNALTGMMSKGVTWFEGVNEPNVTIGGTAFAAQLAVFSAQVRTAGGSVLGPCTIGVSGNPFVDGGGHARWLEEFYSVGGGAYLDGISFHNYDHGGGSLPDLRSVLDGFVNQLTRYGQQNKPRVNSEAFSAFSCVYGSYEPRIQAQWTMMEMHVLEQYGVPKERTSSFYDLSHGFWSFPSWWINSENVRCPNPVVGLVRIWSDELAGKAYSAKLDFGTVENQHFVGSRFTASDGSSVVAVQSGGRYGQVAFEVTGTSSVAVVDAWGTVTNTAVSGGLVTVDVGTLPTYLRLPAGATATPEIVTYGVDVITPRTIFVTKATSTPTTTFPATSTITLPNQTRFDTVVVSTSAPWQTTSGLLDFDVQAFVGGVWTTLGTFTESTKVKQWTSTKDAGGCYSDSYWRRACVFVVKVQGQAVTSNQIRIYVRTMSSGGTPDENTRFGYGVPGSECAQGAPPSIAATVQVFLSGRTDGGNAVDGSPMLPLNKPA